ncbi:hypothetical protein CerSpe_204980 [Prunus speciosa]
MSLDWECTADGGIKAWNVDAKRVVCDLNTSEAFPRHGSSHLDSLGFASLTVWNMKTWKAMTVLPLGKDPPAITSLSFNHNGKIFAAVATDGMIHMFGILTYILGLGINCRKLGDVQADRYMNTLTSIFSLGVDGKVIEWSLQNQGQILWSRNCSRYLLWHIEIGDLSEFSGVHNAGLALGELRKENNILRSLWPVTNPPSSQEHLLHPQLLQKPLRTFLARGYFGDVGV